jgi:hypothetical protein
MSVTESKYVCFFMRWLITIPDLAPFFCELALLAAPVRLVARREQYRK